VFVVRVLVRLAGVEVKGVFEFVVLVLVVEVGVETGPVFGLEVFDDFELDIFVLRRQFLRFSGCELLPAYLHHYQFRSDMDTR